MGIETFNALLNGKTCEITYKNFPNTIQGNVDYLQYEIDTESRYAISAAQLFIYLVAASIKKNKLTQAEAIELINNNKDNIIKSFALAMHVTCMTDVLVALHKLGVDWPDLADIYKNIKPKFIEHLNYEMQDIIEYKHCFNDAASYVRKLEKLGLTWPEISDAKELIKKTRPLHKAIKSD